MQMNKEILDKLRDEYQQDRLVSKTMWNNMDNEGDERDYNLFEMGFVCGLRYARRLSALEELSRLDQELGLG